MNSVYSRVSIRKFEVKPVELEKILEVLRAGMQAPSAANQQPWEFYVVTNRDTIQALSHVSPYSGCAANAPVLIVPVYRKQGLVFPAYAHIDMAIAQENIWLMTDALGLGGVWLGIAPEQERMAAVRKIMNLPEDVEAFSLFAMGYPAQTKQQEDRFDKNRIHFVD